ncbi:MAG: hypothetical protein MJE66_19985 [Proteobacteria bacterium]|nr:hypothetical protein [Pseudomonadota bacterium]
MAPTSSDGGPGLPEEDVFAEHVAALEATLCHPDGPEPLVLVLEGGALRPAGSEKP